MKVDPLAQNGPCTQKSWFRAFSDPSRALENPEISPFRALGAPFIVNLSISSSRSETRIASQTARQPQSRPSQPDRPRHQTDRQTPAPDPDRPRPGPGPGPARPRTALLAVSYEGKGRKGKGIRRRRVAIQACTSLHAVPRGPRGAWARGC